ncbi:MAG: hypothetical protein IAE97_10040 [Chthoniobacterales bacterium]|nr:hypothetical protein [Chthoniobacterales bacterium]
MSSPESPQGGPVTPAGAILFIVTSLVFLVLAGLLLAVQPGFLLAKTLTGHGQAWISLLLFGFGLPAVYGAVYWALPQVFGLPLCSTQAAYIQYGFHLAGLLVVLLLPFVPELPQAAWGGGLMACGGAIFIVNVARTLRRMERPDVAACYLSTMMVWLAAALLLGPPFAAQTPLAPLEGTGWSAGIVVLLAAGVLFNTILGLALRVTPRSLGIQPDRTHAAWYALAVLNAGVAWVFAAATFGPPAFLVFCAVILIAGALIYLSDFRNLLERRRGALSCGVRMLRAAVWMIPMAALLLIHDAGERLRLPPSVPADAAPLVPMPVTIGALDWTVALTAVFAAAIPGLLGILFQLQDLQGGDAPGRGLPERLLPAAFGVYAFGTALLLAGVWTGAGMVSAFGAALLALGALGFLVSFVANLLPRPSSAPAGVVV